MLHIEFCVFELLPAGSSKDFGHNENSSSGLTLYLGIEQKNIYSNVPMTDYVCIS